MVITEPREMIMEFVRREIGVKHPWTNYTTMGVVRNNEIVGGVVFESFTEGKNEGEYQDCCLHVAGKGKYWLNREFIFAVFDYVFNQLKCARITGKVPSRNVQARRFDEHLGFVIEAIIEKALPDDDLIIYRMFREDCRWLK